MAVPAFQGEDKGAAVGGAAAPGVPIEVGHGAEPGVLRRQALQGGVDGLLFGADQADLHFAVLQGEDLGPEHGGVGDADELETVFVRVVPGDDEEPGAVGGAVDVGGLEMPVNPLALRLQEVEVPLGGGGHGLDDVFQGEAVEAVPEVEGQDRHLGVRQELGIEMALAQVFADRKVVGEVAVVHQGGVQGRKGMGAAGVPDPSPGGVALVGDPDVGLKIQEVVIESGFFGVAHDLEDHQVAPLGEHKGLFLAQGGVIGLVELVAVLGHELVFHLAPGDVVELVLLDEMLQHLGLYPHEVLPDLRGFDHQAGQVPPVVDGGLAPGVFHPEDLGDEPGLHRGPGLGVQVGDLDQVIVVEDLLGNPQGIGVQAHRGNAAALAVAPVVHLHRGLEDVAPGHRDAAGKAGNPAAAFFVGLVNAAGREGGGEIPAGVEEGEAGVGKIMGVFHRVHRYSSRFKVQGSKLLCKTDVALFIEICCPSYQRFSDIAESPRAIGRFRQLECVSVEIVPWMSGRHPWRHRATPLLRPPNLWPWPEIAGIPCCPRVRSLRQY